jgi:hypothetical protein
MAQAFGAAFGLVVQIHDPFFRTRSEAAGLFRLIRLEHILLFRRHEAPPGASGLARRKTKVSRNNQCKADRTIRARFGPKNGRVNAWVTKSDSAPDSYLKNRLSRAIARELGIPPRL